MSYILDALRKAERQRPPEKGPELFQVPGPRPPRRGGREGLLAGAAVFLMAAVGVGAWLVADRGEERQQAQTLAPANRVPASPPPREFAPEPPGPAAAVVSPAPSPPPAASFSGRVPPASPRPRPGATVRTPAPQVEAPTPAPAPPPPAAPAVPAAPPTPPAPAPAPGPAAVVEPPAAPSAEVPVPAPSAAPAPPPEPAASVPAPAPPAALPAPEAAPEPAPAPVPPPDGRVLGLAELPDPVRAALPGIALSGHVWSEDATLRLVVVDGRIVREGGEVVPGVVLESVTPEGGVLGFRGYRVRVEAP